MISLGTGLGDSVRGTHFDRQSDWIIRFGGDQPVYAKNIPIIAV
jgi:hypothetical protein